jgi:hypothetical protein
MEIGEMILREMKRKQMSQEVLSKKLHNHPTAVHALMQCKTIQVPKLIKLCGIFEYNFFREIAETIPYQEPNYEVKVDIGSFTAPLEQKINNLQLEVNILRQTLKDLTGH